MNTRLLVSLFWLFGTLALAGAIGGPFAEDVLRIQPQRNAATDLVKKLLEAERDYYQAHERYFYFSAIEAEQNRAAQELKVPVDGGKFLFEATSSKDNALIIRAFTAPAAIEQDRLPPMLYRHAVSDDKSIAGTGGWQPLTGRKPGLLALIGLS